MGWLAAEQGRWLCGEQGDDVFRKPKTEAAETPCFSTALTSEDALAQVACAGAARGRGGRTVDMLAAALLATAPVAPLVAAMLVVSAALRSELKETWFAYLPPVVLLPGMVYLLTAWVFLALIWALLGFTHVKRANAATFCELVNELTESHTMLDRLGAQARTTARLYLAVVATALDGKSWTRASWVLGNGYVSMWQLLHRSQEALIGLEPVDAVVSRAEYDLMRLADSNVRQRDLLRERLRQCIELLAPIAADKADLAERSRVEEVIEASLQQDWRPTSDVTQVEKWSTQLEATYEAVATAPVGSDRKLPVVCELRTALLDLQRSLEPSRQAPAAPPNGSVSDHEARAAVEAAAALTAATPTATLEAPAEAGAEPAVEPPQAQPGEVTYEVKNREALRQQLQKFAAYLGQPAGCAPTRDRAVVETVVARVRDDSVLRAPEFAAEARMLVGTIRQTLNQYRDESRAGLVRARNQLGWTTVVTALVAYTVVWLAVASSVPAEALQVGVSYFLVGALIGLFSRLHGELGSDTATDDYGLSVMRLIAAPQLAGVAAVAGVGLLALTGMTATADAQSSFARAFSLPFQPAAMLAAAGFGLAPGLLIDRLKQQTENLKGNLKTTQPQSGV